jgi:very-short-patch-repair endonuclease
MRRKVSDTRVEDFIEEVAESEKIRCLEYLDMLHRKCESPIEILLVTALWRASKIEDFSIDFLPGGDTIPKEPYYDEAAFVYQQVKIGDYRADFLIHDASLPVDIAPPRIMVVECDGHDYHERTKEQARRDKRRDRYFQSRGFKVLRFTGSEIWADPDKCADEIIEQLARNDDWRNRHA